MSHDDVLFGYHLRLFTLAEEIGVRPACRAMGVHHVIAFSLVLLARGSATRSR